MGSWYKTCGLTNLPIMSGELTYVFVLERVKELDGHCHATHLYRPLLLPFISEYDDYGGGEASSGVAFPLIMDGIRKHLVEVPLGENEIHDIAVSREQWGEELFFKSIHENRLRLNHRRDGECEVSFVMMRKDVVDDLMNTYAFEVYIGDGKENCGSNNSYKAYRFADLIADVDPLLDALGRQLKDEEGRWFRLGLDLDAVITLSLSKYCSNPPVDNQAAAWLWGDEAYGRFSNIIMVRSHIMNMLLQGDRAAARELLIEHFKAKFVDKFMEATRKSWMPGGHEGSQDQDYKPYRALMASMNRVIASRDVEHEQTMPYCT